MKPLQQELNQQCSLMPVVDAYECPYSYAWNSGTTQGSRRASAPMVQSVWTHCGPRPILRPRVLPVSWPVSGSLSCLTSCLTIPSARLCPLSKIPAFLAPCLAPLPGASGDLLLSPGPHDSVSTSICQALETQQTWHCEYGPDQTILNLWHLL